MKLTTCSRLAEILFTIFAACTLHAQTYFLQSLGGQGSPPYPMDPYHGTMPMTEVSDDTYVIEDGDSESLDSGGMMTMDSIDPTDPGNTNSAPLPTPPPDIRNYAKYGAQIFSWLDTNSVLNEWNYTNLYNACAAINGPTNGLPWLTIVPYGPDGVLIRADNFDYSETNAGLALLVCNKVETPTWKVIDFNGASDAQDGWLVQGAVQSAQVTSTMFFQVTNLNMTYNAFFKVIPYSGPQVAIIGTNQPYDTVSNVITLTTQIYDLSGTTNEHFLVDVNGDTISTRSSLSNNTITVDTKYNPDGMNNVDLTAQGFSSVYSHTISTNTPGDILTRFTSATSIPLDFENVNYLAFQSWLADPAIGTNGIVFYCGEEEDITATITDPSNNLVVASYGGSTTGPGYVEIDWNFTEADGVTPYSNSTYLVTFTASDPDTFTFPNQIESNDGVRRPAGCFISYEQEPPLTTIGIYINQEDELWLESTLATIYQDIYDPDGITEYTTAQIGDNRQWTKCQGLVAITYPQWKDFMPDAFSDTYSNSIDGLFHPKYSDLTIGGAHGDGNYIGGFGLHEFPWLPDEFTPNDLQGWLQQAGSDWRLRKAALWACAAGMSDVYSMGNPGPQGQTNGNGPDFQTGCGIRPVGIQVSNYVRKNTAWMTCGLLPFLMQGPTQVDSSPKVAMEADDLWVEGGNPYPGGDDPTYASAWVVAQMQGMYPNDLGAPLGVGATLQLFGYPYLPYTSIYDDELWLLDNHNVKHPGTP
jgi:hypothetical protein